MTDMRSKSQFWDFGGTSKKSNVLFWVCRNEHSELQRASPPEEGLLLKLPQETYDSTSSGKWFINPSSTPALHPRFLVT